MRIENQLKNRLILLKNGKKEKIINFNGIFNLLMNLDLPITKRAIKKRCKYKTETVPLMASEYKQNLIHFYNCLSIHRRPTLSNLKGMLESKGIMTPEMTNLNETYSYVLIREDDSEYFTLLGYLDNDIRELPDFDDGYRSPTIECA